MFNKCDLMAEEDIQSLRSQKPDAVFVSAQEGKGLTALLHRIAREASAGDVTLTALVPYEKGLLIKMVHERCQVIREQYVEEGLLVTCKAAERMAKTLEPYRQND